MGRLRFNGKDITINGSGKINAKASKYRDAGAEDPAKLIAVLAGWIVGLNATGDTG